jgi:hypothetical protein
MTIEAYDTAFPTERAREDVYIDVIRNPSSPIFEDNFYVREISENVNLGTLVLCLTANDADGDFLSYEITGVNNPLNNNDVATEYFFMTTAGCVYVQKNLNLAIRDTYSFTARVRDHAYPEKFGTSTVQIQIERDQFDPRFDLTDYTVTIPETSPVNSSVPIISVRATDQDIKVFTTFIKYQF